MRFLGFGSCCGSLFFFRRFRRAVDRYRNIAAVLNVAPSRARVAVLVAVFVAPTVGMTSVGNTHPTTVAVQEVAAPEVFPGRGGNVRLVFVLRRKRLNLRRIAADGFGALLRCHFNKVVERRAPG